MTLVITLLAAFLAVVLVFAYLPLSRQRQWIDEPNARSAHASPTPNSGGIPVVIAVLVMLLGLQWHLGGQLGGETVPHIRSLVLGLSGLCVVGAWDDRHHLSAGFRLACFFAVAAAVVAVWFSPSSLPTLAAAAVLVIALVWVINLYNFMDGLDGLAAVQVIAVAAGLWLQGLIAGGSDAFLGMAGIVAGAYAGFLVFNWPPARLFMGDAGSLSAGLLLSWLGIWGWSEGAVAPASWCLLMSPFLIDSTWTLLDRFRRGERIAEAHSDHFYQRLARRWGSHRRVDYLLIALHVLWLQPFAAACALLPGYTQTFLLAGLFPQLLLMVRARRMQ